jgi:hypothetical protein
VAALLRLLFLVPLGFVAGSVAAAAVGTLALLRDVTLAPEGIALALLVLVATVGVATIAFVPMAIAIVLAEAFAWRSVFYWLAVGGLIAGGVGATTVGLHMLRAVADIVVLAGYVDSTGTFAATADTNTMTIAIAAGFAGGLVYWLVAGRTSGWREPALTSSG